MADIRTRWRREWEELNPILRDGEQGRERNSGKIKIGPPQTSYAGNNSSVKAATEAAGRVFINGTGWITSADLGADQIHPTWRPAVTGIGTQVGGHQKIADQAYRVIRPYVLSAA
jgi:hypothetical protein